MSRRRKSHPPSPAPARPASPAATASPGAFAVALALAAAGLALSVALARLHVRAHAGYSSFCSVSDVVNCDRVATSEYSVVLGLPVAVWGALGYGLAGALAAYGLSRRPPRAGRAAGLLFLVAAAAVAASVVLALVSEIAIGAFCILCAASWVVSLALLGAAWRACRPAGVAASIQADLAAVREHPRAAAALVMGAAAAVVLAAVAYPRYWERSKAAPAPSRQAAGSPAPAAGAAGSGAPAAVSVPEGVVLEYSDYECPYCARAHEETRAVLAARPDVTLVRRHFPLDASCNPAVARTVHPTACALARAAVCAEAQGRFAEMDDALFRNQREGLAPAALARRIGLDMARFDACVVSPETDRRIQADVAAAVRDGVRATPTYIVDHTVSAGRLPVELLPPARAQRAP